MLVKRKEKESISSLLYRFTKKIKRSGILREARKRRYATRDISRVKRKLSAIHREEKKKEIQRDIKMGLVKDVRGRKR
ncbi:30S ribosomal protein S21 [Patescibacteria group bacterium]|nr:30S ribosomal protein S21 [Patescibacteria group bacterium]